MKKKYFVLVPLLLIAVCTVINSCKKDTAGSVENLISRGTWQLASVIRYNYVGSTNVSIDTLNTKCGLAQTFTFGADNTCSYTDFSCISQTAKGAWKFSDDKLTLISSLSAQDTLGTATVTAQPFINARIINLGQYSMILETGDLSSYYLSTDKRHIKRYGFIRY